MKSIFKLLLVVSLFAVTLAAQSAPTVDDLQKQINALQAQLTQLQAAQEKAVPAPAPKAAAPKVESGYGTLKFDGLLQGWYVGGGDGVTNTFRLRRSELKLSGQITPKAGFTIMIDPSKALSLVSKTNSTTGDLSSVTVNQNSRILQDAFLTLTYIPHARIDFGQQKVPLSLEGLQSSAKLDTVERALFMSDRTRNGSFGDIRDFGIMVSGPVTRFVDYQAGVFNGSGENQNQVSSFDQKSMIGRLVFKPFSGFSVGGSGALGYGLTNSTTRPRRDRMGLEAQYLHGPLTLRSEYMQGKDGVFTRTGYYGHIGYKVTKKIEPILRFDDYDPDVTKDTDKTNARERDYIAGFNYFIDNHYWKVQTDYLRKTFAKDILPQQNVIETNLQLSW